MSWALEGETCESIKFDSLRPDYVLDDTDGARLFIVKSEEDRIFLAYLCYEDADVERHLIVPISEQNVSRLEANDLCIREALTSQALMLAVDLHRDGSISTPIYVEYGDLPEFALPVEGVFLSSEALLRIRLIGEQLDSVRIPSSVVKRAVESATGAMKVLVRHVLDVRDIVGRPTEWVRRLYDLPAQSFAFGSFEVSFGPPIEPLQADLTSDDAVLADVSALLTKGLVWAADENSGVENNEEWAAIVDALAYLAPPRKGVVDRVEVGGNLFASRKNSIVLDRAFSERVATTQKILGILPRKEVTLVGYVREFDKDNLTFILRSKVDGDELLRVAFSEEHYDSAYKAFDSEVKVTLLAYKSEKDRGGELLSLTLMHPETPDAQANQ